jgi:hypothetical protein
MSLRPHEIWAAAAALAVGLGVWAILSLTGRSPASPSSKPPASSPQLESKSTTPERSLLDQFREDSAAGANTAGTPTTDDQLETQFEIIAEFQRQLENLKTRAMAAAASKNGATFKEDVENGKPLTALLNTRLSAFEKDLAVARANRPQDPVVQWLTGELLTSVGGEPDTILPYFRRAVQGGLRRPRLFESLSKIEFDLNRFQAAYDDASKAVDLASSSRDAWVAFSRACFALERTDALIQRLSRAFPDNGPPWVRPLFQEAAKARESWRRELATRAEEDRRGTLPVVRLEIEHRKFASADPGAKTISTGRGQILVELFEDQAPLTVANFIHLVETGFYNGRISEHHQ